MNEGNAVIGSMKLSELEKFQFSLDVNVSKLSSKRYGAAQGDRREVVVRRWRRCGKQLTTNFINSTLRCLSSYMKTGIFSVSKSERRYFL